MSRIDELIAELCPDGVEYRKLIDVFELKNGYTPSKSNPEYWKNGNIPWFRMEDIRKNGRILSDSMQHITPIAVKGGRLLPANSIIIATTATIGEHALITVDSLANQRFTYLVRKVNCGDLIDMNYFFYYCFVICEWCKNNTNMSGFASVNMTGFRKLEIPIPPLEVQKEVVKILDKFTQLEAELSAELEARKKQYEYYRNQLLAFDGDVRWATLSSIVKMARGVRVVKKDLAVTGEIPVYQNSMTPLGYHSESNNLPDTTFIITAGAAGEIGYSNVSFWAADDCFALICPHNLDSKFLYHFLKTQQKFIFSNVRRASIPRLSRKVVEKIKIPVPSIEEQKGIVSILDKFDKLVNDISSGLPAEITARRKQYEYYRTKLLTFKEAK